MVEPWDVAVCLFVLTLVLVMFGFGTYFLFFKKK